MTGSADSRTTRASADPRAEVLGLVLLAVLLAVVAVLFLPLRVGGTAVPVGALVAAVSNALLVRAAGARSSSTAVAAAPLAAWLLTVLALATGGPGGDVLVLADWRALLLLGAGVLPAVLVLGGHLGRSVVRRAQSTR